MGFPSDVTKIINDKFGVIDDAELNLTSAATAIQKKVNRLTINRYGDIASKVSGSSIRDVEDVISTEVNRLTQDLNTLISENKHYKSEVAKYLKSFDDIEAINNNVHQSLNNINTNPLLKIAKKQHAPIIDKIADDLIGQGMNDGFITPVKDIVFSNITLGTTMSEASGILEDFIKGNEDKLGGLRRHAGQIVRDALNQYDGKINQMIANEYELNAVRYVGSLIKDSRPQCVHWAGKGVISMVELNKDIKKINAGGSIGGKAPTGWISGTTIRNFQQYRGGYNCRHQAIPYFDPKFPEFKSKTKGKKPPVKSNLTSAPVGTKAAKELAKKEEQFSVSGLIPQASKDLDFTFKGSQFKPKRQKQWFGADPDLPDQFYDQLTSEPKLRIKKTGKGGSYYRPFSNLVQLDAKRYTSEYGKQQIVAHEFGHAIDQHHKLIQRMPNNKKLVNPVLEKRWEKSIKAFEDDVRKQRGLKKGSTITNDDLRITDEIVSDYKYFNEAEDIRDAINKKMNTTYTKKDIQEMIGATADTLKAVTKNKIGWGHKNSYMALNDFAYAQKEWLAHAMEVYYVGNPYMQNNFPKLYNELIELAKDVREITTGKKVVKKAQAIKDPIPTKPKVIALKDRRAVDLDDAFKNQKEWIKNLTKNEEGAVGFYATDGYSDMNNLLRKPDFINTFSGSKDPFLKKVRGAIKDLDTALDKAPKFQTTSYRGMYLKEEKLIDKYLNLEKGDLLTDKGFMSTSRHKSIADDFASRAIDNEVGVLIEVRGKNGVLIEDLGIKSEGEILFSRDAKFSVKDKVIDEDNNIIRLVIEEK